MASVGGSEIRGTARGSDGTTYSFDTDMRCREADRRRAGHEPAREAERVVTDALDVSVAGHNPGPEENRAGSPAVGHERNGIFF
jgi:hypothetical protein